MHLSLRQTALLFPFPLIAVGLAAQAQVSEPQIEGHVLQTVSGIPIEGATIILVPPMIFGLGSFQTEKTDSNGEYRFNKVIEGTYTIEANADGFVPQTYKRDPHDPSGASEFQTIHAGTRLRNIDFRLSREAVIRGIVTNTDGTPVGSGVPVAAARWDKHADGSEWMAPISGAKTDADGKFSLRKLPPSTYFVCVNGPHGFNEAPTAGGWYRETFYGNSTSVEGAIPIALKEGEEQNGIRITVEREKRYRITVWPSGPDGEAQPDNYQMILEGRDHSIIAGPAAT
jgi:hypothetical protein